MNILRLFIFFVFLQECLIFLDLSYMKLSLTQSELKAVKQSFTLLYSLLANSNVDQERLVNCMYKWGLQLGIHKEEVDRIITNVRPVNEKQDSLKAIEHIYHLVYLIYLDGEVEDDELYLTMHYVESLGYSSNIVKDLIQAISSAPYKEINKKQLQTFVWNDLKSILEENATPSN